MTVVDEYLQILHDSHRHRGGVGAPPPLPRGKHSDRKCSSKLLEPVSVSTATEFGVVVVGAHDEEGGGAGAASRSCSWLASPSEVRSMRRRDFREKEEWFRAKCNILEVGRRRPSGGVAVRIVARGGSLLEDATDAVLGMTPAELRKAWDIDLEGEEEEEKKEEGGRAENKDALAREWFALVTESVCDAGRGLWRRGEVEDVGLQINPWSGMIHTDHLEWFRFMGRVMGKALFDGRTIPNQIIPYIYKFLVGSDLTLLDLKQCDPRYYDVVKDLEATEDLGNLGMNFTLTEENPFGGEKHVELIPGGVDVRLTAETLGLYKECLIRYLLIDRLKPQLTELFGGIHEVVPRQLLGVFESHELEIIMCGSLGISHLQVPE